MPEVWRAIEGFEGLYEVSDRGNVRRVKGGHGVMPLSVLKVRVHRNGYRFVCLSRDDRQTYRLVHRLVAAAFIRPPIAGEESNHKDGDKANNAAHNLEWVTRGENIAHSYRIGIRPKPNTRGSRNGRAKVTPAIADQIRAAKGKERQKDTAARFGVSKATVHYIQSGKRWSEWPEDLRVREFPGVAA